MRIAMYIRSRDFSFLLKALWRSPVEHIKNDTKGLYDNSVWNKRHSWFVSTSYPLGSMYLINAIVCMEHNTGMCPPTTQPGPSLCPLEAAPDHAGRRGNVRQRAALAEAGSDGCMGPSYRLERGTKVFWKKDGRVCPGERRNATWNKPGLKKVGCACTSVATWGWPQVRVRFWHQEKLSRAAAVIAACLHWGSSWGPAPRWVKRPKERCQRAPLLTSWQSASLQDSRRGAPDSPRQPGGMPADLRVTTCKSGWSCSPYLHFNLTGGWRHSASARLQDLGTWAVARQNTGLLWILLSYMWLEGAMK